MKCIKGICVFLVFTFCVLFASGTALAYDRLKMLNSTGKTIYFVYLQPKGHGWGNDRLSGTWHNGNTLTLNVSNYRWWALKIRFEDDSEVTWAKDHCIDTSSVYNLTIARNNSGGYTLYYNN